MAIATANIRTSITEVLNGSGGTTRTLSVNTFAFGVFKDQPVQAQQAKALDTVTGAYRFDVELGPYTNHESTPESLLGNVAHRVCEVKVPVWLHLSTTPEEAARNTQKAAMESALDDAIAALSYPANLTQTQAAGATNIIGGYMTGLGGEGVPEFDELVLDYANTQLATSTIRGAVLLKVTLAT